MTIEYMNQSWLSFRKSFRSEIKISKDPGSLGYEFPWIFTNNSNSSTNNSKGLRVPFASTTSGFPWFTTKSPGSGLVWAHSLARRHIKDTSPNSQPQEFLASHNEVKPDSPFGWTYLSYNLLVLRESQLQPFWHQNMQAGSGLLAWTWFNEGAIRHRQPSIGLDPSCLVCLRYWHAYGICLNILL